MLIYEKRSWDEDGKLSKQLFGSLGNAPTAADVEVKFDGKTIAEIEAAVGVDGWHLQLFSCDGRHDEEDRGKFYYVKADGSEVIVDEVKINNTVVIPYPVHEGEPGPEPEKCTIHFIDGDSGFITVPADQEVEKGTEVAINTAERRAELEEKEGMHFTQFEDATGHGYVEGETVTVNEDLTVYVRSNPDTVEPAEEEPVEEEPAPEEPVEP